MAVLFITEYVSQGVDLNGRQLPVAALPILAQQAVTISTVSLSSSSFQTNTQLVRLHSDTVCSVNISSGATAASVTTNMRMAANHTEYFNVPSNSSYRVAVIANV